MLCTDAYISYENTHGDNFPWNLSMFLWELSHRCSLPPSHNNMHNRQHSSHTFRLNHHQICLKKLEFIPWKYLCLTFKLSENVWIYSLKNVKRIDFSRTIHQIFLYWSWWYLEFPPRSIQIHNRLIPHNARWNNIEKTLVIRTNCFV